MMSHRDRAFAVCAWVGLGLGAAGCGGAPSAGPTPEAHDQDAKAEHMVNPAGGPNSPEAKAATPPAK